MSNYVVAFQCHCRQQFDAQNKDRIVTEACGHSKCRNCFIKEESGCVKCLSSKTRDDERRPISETAKPNNVFDNDDIIQLKPIGPSNGPSRPMSNPKDIRVLEEVIIKPCLDLLQKEPDSLIVYPRMKEYQQFKYPSHITWRVVDGKTEFECKICKKSFRSKSNRKYHLYCDETVEKPFNCTKCTKTFATKSHLAYHESRHTNTQHDCNECDRTFLSRISLQKHSKVHTNDFKYCDHCDMKFYNKSDLILHMYSHKTSPLPFPCDTCNKSFSAKFKLNQHQETHKGTKSHGCQLCGKRFTRNSSLTIHMLTHSNADTKFECSFCSKSFDRQRSHDRHMKIKHGSTVFQCPLCDIQSGRRDNILRHIRNLHSDENFEEIMKKISKTIARPGVPDVPIKENETVFDVQTIDNATSNVCQYQSVIQFAGRSTNTPPAPPTINVIDECSANIGSSPTAHASVENDDDNIDDDNLRKSFNNELSLELEEQSDRGPKISNISIYRQLLSPYLRPPPNLNCRNGSQEQHSYRGYQDQSDRLPMRKENVDIYRSILMSTTEPEQETVIQSSSGAVQEDENVSNNQASLVIHGQSSEYFSEMHWRKRTSQCFNRMKQ